MNPERIDTAAFEQNKAAWATRDYPLGVNIGSLYGWIAGGRIRRRGDAVHDDPACSKK